MEQQIGLQLGQNFKINKMRVLIAADHAGVELKQYLVEYLIKDGVLVTDFGTNTIESVNYANYAHQLCAAMDKNTYGILICGSGNGMCMTANKYPSIRAALCWDIELAELARSHNNANILCLPARFIAVEDAVDMVNVFLNTPFEGGRHESRINQIPIK